MSEVAFCPYSPPTCRDESSLVVEYDLEEGLVPVLATPTGLFCIDTGTKTFPVFSLIVATICGRSIT